MANLKRKCKKASFKFQPADTFQWQMIKCYRYYGNRVSILAEEWIFVILIYFDQHHFNENLLLVNTLSDIPQLFGPPHLFDTEECKVAFNLDQFKSKVKHWTKY